MAKEQFRSELDRRRELNDVENLASGPSRIEEAYPLEEALVVLPEAHRRVIMRMSLSKRSRPCTSFCVGRRYSKVGARLHESGSAGAKFRGATTLGFAGGNEFPAPDGAGATVAR